MSSVALDTDQWLKDNTFHCVRLDANISKSACDIYRAENQDQIKKRGNIESALKITIPGCCQGCSQADGELLESKYKTRFTDNLYPKGKKKQKLIKKIEKPAPDITPESKIKEGKMADKKTGDCVGPCGRKDIVMVGRGLCSKCYYHVRKAEKSGPLGQEKTHQETVAVFIQESCVVGCGEITLLDIYAAFKYWWCENPENGSQKPLTNVEFFKALVDFTCEVKGDGQTYVQGVALVVEEPSQENNDHDHSGLGIDTEKEDVADQLASNLENYEASEATAEKIGVMKEVLLSSRDKKPVGPGNVPMGPAFPIDPGVKNQLSGEKIVNKCRECGCTELDCSVCIEKTGQPCYWVEPDLCSACVPNWIPCNHKGEVLGDFDLGSFYTLNPGEHIGLKGHIEETEAALLDDLCFVEKKNVASVTKILRVGDHEFERTTVYKNQSSGLSGLKGYLPAIILPITITASILIHPEYWQYYIFVSIQVGGLFAALESRKKKG